MAHIFRLLHGRHLVEQVFPYRAAIGLRIDGEIAHAKRGKILEEVRALAGVNMIMV